MAKYIDMEAARNSLYEADAITMNGVAMLNNFPAADVEEVKHGRWIIDEYEYYDCSVCGQSYFNGCDSRKEAEELLRERPYDVYAYCPYCGAKMDGGKENEKP